MRFSSFQEMLRNYAETTPEAPALWVPGERGAESISFSVLEDAVERRSTELKAGGKTCLAVFADGSGPCVITIFAAVRAGLQVVLLDDSLPDDTAAALIRYTDADAIWSADDERVSDLAPALTDGVTNGVGRILFFTSGTTERSKAVVLTERSLCASAWNGAKKLPLQPSDRLLCLLPLGHVFGFVCGMLWGLSCGASVALGRGPRHYMDDGAYYCPTAVSLVPALLGFFVTHWLFNQELRLLLIGAGSCPQDLIQAAKVAGLRVAFGYGLTETSSGVAISTGGDPYAMEICPDDAVNIAPDGEILIHAPTCMMEGYYKREADTAAVLRDGWLHTGDLGRLDTEGRLYITGRTKDILVLPGGTKLFLPEYEGELAAALGNSELAVGLCRGVPALILKDEPDREGEIRAAIRPLMDARPRGEQIGQIVFVDTPLPRTATGKLRRWELDRLLNS